MIVTDSFSVLLSFVQIYIAKVIEMPVLIDRYLPVARVDIFKHGKGKTLGTFYVVQI
jgi:hypothetical protein